MRGIVAVFVTIRVLMGVPMMNGAGIGVGVAHSKDPHVSLVAIENPEVDVESSPSPVQEAEGLLP